MIAAHLVRSTEETHRSLAARLDTAAAMKSDPDAPRKGYERTDAFLAATSRHLNAVESVLLPVAQKRLDDTDLVHDYVRASKDLEMALVDAKGREYGSAYSVSMSWQEVWDAVRTRLERERAVELELAQRLEGELDAVELDALADRLETAEPDAPSRPHPHAPHLGAKGRVARRVLHTIDAFWDTAEGRIVPEKEHAAHKKPGLLGQYLLADPRFDEDEDT
ncbi:MAG TPA: hypothetical protein VFE07_14135 [Marmoricola sp.]|nr:hypothetical protein [Marmoricola sp.]